MMMNDLPSNFDVIVVGTGMPESIFAAAASRIGKNVLHIDSNGYYGGHWASFNLESFQELASVSANRNIDKDKLSFGNEVFNLRDFTCRFHRNVNKKEGNDDSDRNQECLSAKCTKPITEDKDNTKSSAEDVLDTEVDNTTESINKSNMDQKLPKKTEINKEYLMKHFRKFNIDLAPKLHYARGDLVNLLVSANIARYSEYRSVGRVLTWLNNALEEVPCSRSDVFANNKVSVIEKRMLMKLFTSLDDITEDIAMEKKTFRNYLKEKKLSESLIHYVLYAISMSDDTVSCMQGIQNTKRFLSSLGRFGRTPFLFSMYGSGELSQGFCRVCAVFGGTYALNQPLSHIKMNEGEPIEKFNSIVVDNNEIKANHLVMGIDKTPQQFLEKFVLKDQEIKFISRAILITDKSLKVHTNKDPYITMVLYPPENNNNLTTILELGNYTGTCAEDTYLVHMIAKRSKSAEEDFKDCIKNLFSNEEEVQENDIRPNILWSCYFSIPYLEDISKNGGLNIGENIFLCSGPDLDLDYDNAIKEAKNIFERIYPESEFLPKCPDPEDIIIEGAEDDVDKMSEQKDSNEVVTTSDVKENNKEHEDGDKS